MMTGDQSNWRNQCIALLAKQPTEWMRLSELFAAVEPEIPLHLAMRHATRNQRNTDIGVNTARWRLFCHYINKLVERRASDGISTTHRASRTDVVRLLPDKTPCDDCGGPRFLLEWGKPGFARKYTCPACAEPVVIPIPKPEPKPEPAFVSDRPRSSVVEQAAHNGRVAGSNPAGDTKKRNNAHQRRGERVSHVIPTPPKPSHPKPRVRRVYQLSPELPTPPKPIVESKKPITVTIGRSNLTFENWRIFANSVRTFLGFGSINQLERELQTAPNLATVLGRRGRTLNQFVARLHFNIGFNKAK